MKEKVKLITSEINFSEIHKLISEGTLTTQDRIKLRNRWAEIIVENIRREK